MALIKTPICEFDKPAVDFDLLGVDGRRWTLADCRSERATLVMFICNHCPYVKAIRERLISDVRVLQEHAVGCVAIMPNDPTDYPEDSFDNMKKTAQQWGFSFPYLLDETQDVARAYGAVCTPDFFGYNADLKLQYRGRLDSSGMQPAPSDARRELVQAMRLVARTGRGPDEQTPSMGCSIKWKNNGR
ncbi:MAG: thioredoxin family protein [Gammaproteobacteria bacterium]